MTPLPPRDEDADEELDVSALMAFGASCRAFDGYHAKSDVDGDGAALVRDVREG